MVKNLISRVRKSLGKWHSYILLEGGRLTQPSGKQPDRRIHDIAKDVDREALSSTAGGSINWFHRQTLKQVQQGTFTVMFPAAI